MSDTRHGSYTFADFRLQSGEVMPQVTLAYCTRGTLAPDGRNAVLVTHGYTSGHRMIEPGAGSSEGAWSELVGPGAPIDTESSFVVCSNMLGSSYGSTNAASSDPRTGRPYGSQFPRITVADIVTAQRALLRQLGVQHLRAVVGPSYGGFQAFQWAVSFPDDMDGIVPVVTAPRVQAGDRVARLLARFAANPNWHGGDYYDTPGMGETMLAIRMETLRNYGMSVPEAELTRIASAWASQFDANSLLILARAMESFDVTPSLNRIRVPVLYVLSRTDELFPPSLAPEVMAMLHKAGVDASYVEIDSEHGHLASGTDAGKWAPALREFMAVLSSRGA
ncbi:MAG: alpha/beta fold hydrolase [Acetobacteraceae bacterium]